MIPKQNENQTEIFSVLGLLKQGKFPICLVSSKSSQKIYALKLFPYQNEEPNQYYLNEKKFTFLKHESIIAFLNSQDHQLLVHEGFIIKVSYILMELAPYGDFYDFVVNRRMTDEILIRTYFHQLIEGLEYMHNNGVAHLDLKLQNMLIGENFHLKIADFDLAWSHDCNIPVTRQGTLHYRAPEVVYDSVKDPMAADIYSAGIILFVLKTNGTMPFTEEGDTEDKQLFALFLLKDPAFWEQHAQIQNQSANFFDKDFRELFYMMTNLEPSKRAKIKEIKNSAWYKGPIYNQKELKYIMEAKLKIN